MVRVKSFWQYSWLFTFNDCAAFWSVNFCGGKILFGFYYFCSTMIMRNVARICVYVLQKYYFNIEKCSTLKYNFYVLFCELFLNVPLYTTHFYCNNFLLLLIKHKFLIRHPVYNCTRFLHINKTEYKTRVNYKFRKLILILKFLYYGTHKDI